MIMNTLYEEEVNGHIVGGYMLIGTLRYEGRQQGNTLYCETEGDLRMAAKASLSEIKRDCGQAFDIIFPKKAWELRIHD